MFALCDGEFIHSFTTASGVFCPAAMFSAAEVYETLFCFKTIDQLVPSGRWCENRVAVSFERMFERFVRVVSFVRGESPSFARAAFTSSITLSANSLL